MFYVDLTNNMSELKQQNRLKIDRDLINKKFNSYKLNFDAILANNNTFIDLTNPHKNLQTKKSPKFVEMDRILRMDYGFILNDKYYYFDINGIYYVNEMDKRIQNIYSFDDYKFTLQFNIKSCYFSDKYSYIVITGLNNGNSLTVLELNNDSNELKKLIYVPNMILNGNFVIQTCQRAKIGNIDHLCLAVLMYENKSMNNKVEWIPNVILMSLNVNQRKDKWDKKDIHVHGKLTSNKQIHGCFFDDNSFWIIGDMPFIASNIETINDNESDHILGKRKNTDDIEQKSEPAKKKRKITNQVDTNGLEFDSDIQKITLQQFNIQTMKIMHSYDFSNTLCRRFIALNHYTDGNILCNLGFQFNYDMAIFQLKKLENKYTLHNIGILPGLSMIINERPNKKHVILTKNIQQIFVADFKQYISSFLNPSSKINGIQDSIQLGRNDDILSTQIINDKFYCLTPSKLHIFTVQS